MAAPLIVTQIRARFRAVQVAQQYATADEPWAVVLTPYEFQAMPVALARDLVGPNSAIVYRTDEQR